MSEKVLFSPRIVLRFYSVKTRISFYLPTGETTRSGLPSALGKNRSDYLLHAVRKISAFYGRMLEKETKPPRGTGLPPTSVRTKKNDRYLLKRKAVSEQSFRRGKGRHQLSRDSGRSAAKRKEGFSPREGASADDKGKSDRRRV